MKKSIIISLLVIFVPITVFAAYNERILSNAKAKIAEPIFIVESIDQKEEDFFYTDSVKEYNFKVKNTLNQRASEIAFNYKIKINSSNSNFPVSYQLFNSQNEELLNGGSSTNEIIVSKNEAHEEQYKLLVTWKDMDGNLSEKTDINIEIIALQVRE